MRFMIIRRADEKTESGVLPSEELFAKMGAYMEEMGKAGILLGGEGLKPSSEGALVRRRKGRTTVLDGPFAEAKELIAGYSTIMVNSLQEAIEWVKKWPLEDGDVDLEIRPYYEAEDFGAEFTPELREQEERLRAESAAKAAKK